MKTLVRTTSWRSLLRKNIARHSDIEASFNEKEHKTLWKSREMLILGYFERDYIY
jgi:hypothetical protein